MSSTITNEQPVSKRQRIDSVNRTRDNDTTNSSTNEVQRNFGTISNCAEKLSSSNTPPDILPITTTTPTTTTPTAHNLINLNKSEIFISSNATESLHQSKIRCDSDELDNVAAIRNDNCHHSNGHHDVPREFPDLLKLTNLSSSTSLLQPTSSSSLSSSLQSSPSSSSTFSTTTSASTASLSSASNTCSELHIYQPNLASSGNSNSSNNNNSSNRVNESTSNNRSRANNLDEFQVHLSKQCLCRISDRTLRRPFEAHYNKDKNGIKHILPLNEWPNDKIIHFLSNVQLLFDVYLKQNSKGQICSKIMKVCNELVNNEHSIIDEIFSLHDYSNKFVQFLAGRVIASCMVIAKDKKEYYESWLITLVSNLIIDHTEYAAMQKVTFSLEIILRILEWKDIDEHPLEDTVVIDGRAVGTENFSLPLVVPPIENNYFAMHYNEDVRSDPTQLLSSTTATTSYGNNTPRNNHSQPTVTNNLENMTDIQACRLEIFTDSESFDTSDLKCNIVCELKTKWSYLVDSMGECITQPHHNQYKDQVENTILTFLTLWERIISVQANLSVDSTLPFHDKLTIFLDILVGGNLSITIYKQILTLFNESLCYGTTLALQSVLPEETNKLANEIFNTVKNQRIFNSLPVQHAEPENDVGFIGYKNPTIYYPAETCHNDGDIEDTISAGEEVKSADFVIIQKLVLLILKAIAVTVKPVRGDDSSDSSMDGCNSNSSTDYEAYQATIQIERATRDVLKKLNSFMKNKLNHHPETHFSKMILHLFADQDDYLIEAMVCVLDTTTAFLPRQTTIVSSNVTTRRNQFSILINMLCPVYSFLEFLDLISNKTELLLDFLVSTETCFLLYLLRFLKYIRSDWQTFQDRCNDWIPTDNGLDITSPVLDRAMSVLIRLRLLIERLVLQSLYPYDISPIIELLQQCESLYDNTDPFALV